MTTINFPFRFANLPRPRLTADDIRVIENFEKAVKIRQQPNGRLVYYINYENKEKMRKAANVLNKAQWNLEASGLRRYLSQAVIKTAWRASRARARGNIMLRAPNGKEYFNPARFRRYIRNQAATKRSAMRKNQSSTQLPRLNRNFGTWHNWGNVYLQPDMKAFYYPNLKTLKIGNKVYGGNNLNRFGLPKNWLKG